MPQAPKFSDLPAGFVVESLPEGFVIEDTEKKRKQAQPQGMGFWEAASAFLGNMQEPGAADLLLGPVKIAKEVMSRTRGPESVGAGVLPITPNAAPLMNMMLSFSQLAKEGQAQGVDTLQGAGMPGWLGALLKSGGIGQQLDPAGMVSGTAANGVEMARALKSMMTGVRNPTEDAKRFLSLLGSTTANVGSLGLEGTPTGLAQRVPGLRRLVGAPRGAQAAANSAPAAAPPSDAIPVPRSEIVPENVFGETPGASAALPEKPTIPQTYAQESGSKGAAVIERTLAASIPGAGDFQKLMGRQADTIYNWGREIVSSISKDGANLPAREVGKMVQGRIAEAKRIIQDTSNRLYEEVWNDPVMMTRKKDPWGNPVPADVIVPKDSPVANAARRMLGDVDREIKSKLKLNPEAESIADVDPKLSQKFQALRTLAQGEFAQPIKSLVDLKNEFFAKGGSDKIISRAIDDTINTELRKLGGDRLLSKFEKAQAKYRQLKTVEENALFKSMVESGDTAGLADVFLNAGAEDRAMMRNLLKPKDVNTIVARKLSDILESSKVDLSLWDSMTGEAAKSAAAAGENVSGKPPVLSGSKAAAKIRNVGGTGEGLEVLGELLSPKQRSALSDFVSTAQEAGVNNWKSINGVLINSMLLGGSIGVITGSGGGGLLPIGATIATTKALSYAMTHPDGIRAAGNVMRAYGRAVKTGGKAAASPWSDPQVQFWGTRLSKLAAEQDEKNRDLEGVASDLPGGGYVAR